MTKNQKKRNAAHHAAMNNKPEFMNFYFQGIIGDKFTVVQDKYNKIKNAKYYVPFICTDSKNKGELFAEMCELYNLFMQLFRHDAIGEAYLQVRNDKEARVYFTDEALCNRYDKFITDATALVEME